LTYPEREVRDDFRSKNIPPRHSEFRKLNDGINRGEEELITTLSPFDLNGSFPLIRSAKIIHFSQVPVFFFFLPFESTPTPPLNVFDTTPPKTISSLSPSSIRRHSLGVQRAPHEHLTGVNIMIP